MESVPPAVEPEQLVLETPDLEELSSWAWATSFEQPIPQWPKRKFNNLLRVDFTFK